jgi:predicted transcriptional regulator
MIVPERKSGAIVKKVGPDKRAGLAGEIENRERAQTPNASGCHVQRRNIWPRTFRPDPFDRLRAGFGVPQDDTGGACGENFFLTRFTYCTTLSQLSDPMADAIPPTERELEILKILWDKSQASVREVYEQMRRSAPIVQNTVQAFLRTMEDKGLVRHRVRGRTFIYQPVLRREETEKRLVSGVLQRVFDGAIDQLVESALSLRRPTEQELTRLEELIREHKTSGGQQRRPS